MPKKNRSTAAQRAREASRAGDKYTTAFRRFLTLDEHGLCECTHSFDEHDEPDGPCRGLDSYEQPCACPSFVEFRDDD